MKIAIIGAGALGSYVGAVLGDAGEDVVMYDVRADYVKLIQDEGLTISPMSGQSKHYKPKIVSDLAGLPKQDAVIISTKSYHTKSAIEGATSLISDDTLVCSFQNGMGNPAQIAAVVGKPERIIAITIAHSFMMVGPNHVQYFLGAGGVDLGAMVGGITQKVKDLGDVLKKLKVPVSVHDKGAEVVWNKILWNAVLNSTAAVTGMDVPAMAGSAPMKEVLNAIGDEYFAVSEKAGLKVWHQRNFVELLIFAAQAAGKIKSVKPPKPSMLQDIEAGRPTEVEFINGAIVELGAKHGVPTPVNKIMVALVKTIETRAKPAV